MKLLIAEDSPTTRLLIEYFAQQQGYEIVSVGDGLQAWNAMQEDEDIRIVISDRMMPNIDGLELCRRIRGMEERDYTYFIMLTACDTKQDMIMAMESGVDDFLIKPFDNTELFYRLKIGERIIQLESRIKKMADTDPLTGILNRRAFMKRFEAEAARSIRDAAPLAVIMADVDLFKSVNDTYGHQAGDRALEQFAGQLGKSARAYDILARYGGEEFILCLPGTGRHQALHVAERMRAITEGTPVATDDGKVIRITASFGVASLTMTDPDKADRLIQRADEALYRAKRGGRNRVTCHRPDGDEAQWAEGELGVPMAMAG